MNESSVEFDVYDAISASDAYVEYKQTVSDAVNKLVERVMEEVPEFDEGDTDHSMALDALISDATSEKSV